MHPQLLAAAPATPRLALPDVTLLAATSVALPQTVRALELTLARIEPAATVLLSDHAPLPGSSPGIEWRAIPRITSHAAYSRFMLRELAPHVATSHLLCVQWDGYVLDAGGWTPEFLAFDYVGAPWPHFTGTHVVGNGGFSLRSRRLLDALLSLGVDGEPEDVAICRTHRVALERRFGIRFAPPELARRFAFERERRRGGEFGFHGVFNLARLIDGATMAGLLRALEPGVMSPGEHRELLRLAVMRGRMRLAWMIGQRLRARRAAARATR